MRLLVILIAMLCVAGRTSAEEPVIFSTDLPSLEAVKFSFDGKTLAALGSNTIYHWDLKTGKKLWSIKAEANYISSLVYSPNSKQILSGGYGAKRPAEGGSGMVSVWDASTGKAISSFEVADQVEAVAFCSDVARIAVGGYGGLIRVLDAKSGLEEFALKGHDGNVRGLTAEGARLFSSSQDGTVRIWELKTQKQAAVLECGEGRVLCLATDGKKAVVGHEKEVVVWDLALKKAHRMDGHTGPVLSVALSPDGRMAVSTASLFGGEVIVWDLVEKKAVRTIKPPKKEAAFRVAYSHDGKKFATACYGGVVRVYDANGK